MILSETIVFQYGVRAASELLAPFIFPTPFCENRYQKLAALAERCCFFCKFSASFLRNGVKYSIFSVLHKGFTAFAYRIRAPPSEI